MLPIERSILETSIQLRLEGVEEVHGFLLASKIRAEREARLLTARGTLYKALDRLAKRGYLASRWEDPNTAMSAGRPPRRLYTLTAAGEAALQVADAPETVRLVPRPAS